MTGDKSSLAQAYSSKIPERKKEKKRKREEEWKKESIGQKIQNRGKGRRNNMKKGIKQIRKKWNE